MKPYNFTMNSYFTMGIVCFIIIALGSAYSLYFNWALRDIGAKISGCASIFFNFLICALFIKLKKDNAGAISNADKLKGDAELQKALDEVKDVLKESSEKKDNENN